MSSDLDMTRIVRSWLRTDERESADGVLAEVLRQLDTTPQRHRLRSVGAVVDVTAYVRLAMAAAAVVVVALVGVNLLPGSAGPAGTSSTIAPSARPSSSSSPAAYPREAGPGRHSVVVDGVQLSFNLPATGWESHEYYLSKSTVGPQGAEAIIFWATFPGGWISPSKHTGRYVPCIDLLGQPEGRSVADLAAVVSAVRGTDDVKGPADVTVGGLGAKYVSFFVTYSVLDNESVCGPGFFFSWPADDGGAMWVDTIPGDTIRVWIVDVAGTLLFIEAATHWNAGPELELEIRQLVDSIQFE